MSNPILVEGMAKVMYEETWFDYGGWTTTCDDTKSIYLDRARAALAWLEDNVSIQMARKAGARVGYPSGIARDMAKAAIRAAREEG